MIQLACALGRRRGCGFRFFGSARRAKHAPRHDVDEREECRWDVPERQARRPLRRSTPTTGSDSARYMQLMQSSRLRAMFACRGPDAIADYAMSWLRAFPDGQVTVNNDLESGEWVFMSSPSRVRMRSPSPGLRARSPRRIDSSSDAASRCSESRVGRSSKTISSNRSPVGRGCIFLHRRIVQHGFHVDPDDDHD